MPTYNYRCESCTHDFEVRHSMSSAAPACPACGGTVRKVLTAPAVFGASGRADAVFSGGGSTTPSASACGCGKTHGCH